MCEIEPSSVPIRSSAHGTFRQFDEFVPLSPLRMVGDQVAPTFLDRHPICCFYLCLNGFFNSHFGKKIAMFVETGSLLSLTAGDLMSRNVVVLASGMPLREAARLLLQNQIGGAPVVDAQGKCVGVFSAVDFLRFAAKANNPIDPRLEPLPVTCSFLGKHKTEDGKETYLCTLPPGVCPIQVTQIGPDGTDVMVCNQPHCVMADWQIVEVEKMPTQDVRQFMTADPVTVAPEVSIRRLAQLMIDAHIHRIVVVNDEKKPIGIVSSTDILAAVAYADLGT